ncbi:CRISPR-associated endoribonuclease Cas6 [Sporolactobacillus sp. CPB3-1]|uniref:CRISPR-associated endoribonuclease Cas6 n=1 Tax=Sporolactobacillus mangiferae TaxID=2940498 RepID=A0ABT0MDZ7_9BACL|nr:CRISPR-associated endoribonuclease Cas6 [Sporolactobacillus mangiferae]MCL1632494.1 CRISPR-associated endoribonuclease Cas6 [Sporolactobacillus mangiferae]
MRARLTFSINGFPLAFRLGVVSFVKECIRSESKTFYHQLFHIRERQCKPFTFAVYFPRLKVQDDTIIADQMIITISSVSYELMMYLFNGSQKNREYLYKKYSMNLSKFELLREKQISSSRIWMTTLSPILVEDKEGKPVLFNQANFEREFNIIMQKRLRSSENRDLYRPLIFRTIRMKKMVIKENFHQDIKDYLYFTTNTGDFLIEGDIRDLEYLYKNGCSLRSQLGFGMVDLLG